MSEEAEAALAVGWVLSGQMNAHRQFMRILLMRLKQDCPDFRSDLFLEALYVWQEHIPMPKGGDNRAMKQIADADLMEWGIITGIAEQALQS